MTRPSISEPVGAAPIPMPTTWAGDPQGFTITRSVGIYAPDAPGVAALLRDLLHPATGLPLPDAAAGGPGTISLLVDRGDTDLGEEGYRLDVTSTGVTATATGVAGLHWAVQSLRQLLPVAAFGTTGAGCHPHSDAGSGPGPDGSDWTVAGAHIVDVPRYRWRGLMIDVARWYQPVTWLYTVVDLLAMHRMNVMHLHLTDDQGWRFEVRRYPRLTEVGAYRSASPLGHETDHRSDHTPHGGYYSQRELRDLVGYAARRGITIVPELDLPGHSQAALAAHPELGNDPSTPVEVWSRFGISTRVLNVADDTVAFFRNVLDELVGVFPSRYIHLGGDEVRPDEWSASPRALARLADLGLSDPQDLVGWWITSLAAHLATHGRQVVVWDDLIGHGAPRDAVVMAWQGEERVADALRAGHSVIATPHTALYLNYPASGGPHEPLSIASGYPEGDFGPVGLAEVYRYDPQPPGPTADPATAPTADPAAGPAGCPVVIGAQGNLWTEYAPTPARAEYDLMPRLAAVAEVAWGGPRDEAGFRARMVDHLAWLDAAGIGYRPLDPTD
jgi:hexosaminidase